MYPGNFAEPTELSERRYLVATLLYDSWLPRALVADIDLAEQKALYWSSIYGPPRTRISEVWVAAKRPRRQPPRPAAPPSQPAFAPAAAPKPPAWPKSNWAKSFAKLDRPLNPTYAKGLIDGFLLYVGTQIALRVLEILKFGSLAMA